MHFLGVEKILYRDKIHEEIILDANESEKIKWLYQNQLVRFSELKGTGLKLRLIWDSDQKEKFNTNFEMKVL